jgi:hypothetical protein
MSNRCCYYDTSFRQDMVISLNVTWQDSFQIGDPADQSWNLIAASLQMALKADPNSLTSPLLMSTDNGRILIDDAVARIFTFNVSPNDLQAALVPDEYSYDLLIVTATNTIPVMHGKVCVELGIT